MSTRSCRDFDYLYKIIIVGDGAVGKSSLILRFADDEFSELSESTIGIDMKIRTICLDGTLIKLQLWDTAGQERFRAFTPDYYRKAHGIIIAYDSTNKKSFQNLTLWQKDIDFYTSPDTQKLLVGTKCDRTVDKVITYVQAKTYANHLGIPCIETSSKCNLNVDETFILLAKQIFNNMECPLNAMSDSIRIESQPVGTTESQNWSCCY